MIDFVHLMTQAEQELIDSDTLLRTTKAGILYGVLAQSLQQYTQTPVTHAEVLALMGVLVKDGHLFDTLPRSEGLRQPVSAPTRRPAGITAPADPAFVAPEEGQQTAEEAEEWRIMAAKGYRAEEIAAILALKKTVSDGAEVLYRTDADLARHEAEQENPFPGLPQGLPLNGFTATVNDPLPPDLRSS